MDFRDGETSVVELLERHFEVAFSAPDGVKKLRELILTLAMKGKLVPQDPNDQPASEMLKEIEAEKQRLVKEGKIKNPKALPPITADDVPYELPDGWEWVRLGEITAYNGRKNISGDQIDPDTWVLDLEDIEKDTSRILYRAKFSERQSKSTKSTFLKGDVLYGKLRPYLDKIVVADRDGVCTTEIVPIVSFVGLHSDFLKWLLKRPAFLSYVNSLMYGVKMPRLGTDNAVASIHPLPPLPEQHRIVARIDELMAHCDELEKLRAEREQKRVKVHAAAVRQLLDTTEPESSANAWQFISRNFRELYSDKENVAELRKAILQLAVMGKLVPQDPNDPPACELLKEIEAEKQRLVKEGKIKKPKAVSPIKPDEVPYPLPDSWEWVRLGDVISYMDAGWSPKCETGPASDSEWGVLKTTAVQKLEFLPHENKTLPIKLTPRPEYQVEEKDILITRAGPKNRVGICCVATSIRPKLMLSDKIIRFKIYGDLISPDYCALSLNTGYCSEQIEMFKSGMAESQMNISQDKVKRLLMLIPPLPEQHRIVARIDQLMALCDTLEQQIDDATRKQTELLNAVMTQV
ncbi:restriction endonuclease subunit S [Chlorobaculum parvum]|nr:restriction endonuclease subunit S [Chlorobaculum parvum]